MRYRLLAAPPAARPQVLLRLTAVPPLRWARGQRRGWRPGGAARCSLPEEARKRIASQPLNDPELLVGWAVLELPKRTLVGVVEEVVYVGEGAAPLLRVVGAAAGDARGAAAREEHLVPFVREIVPQLDAGARTALLRPPPGLLELGRRRRLLAHLRPLLLEYAPPTRRLGAAPYMPTGRALAAAGRADLVREVQAAGGFLEVAQQLGLRARRRPKGFWDSQESLEQARA